MAEELRDSPDRVHPGRLLKGHENRWVALDDDLSRVITSADTLAQTLEQAASRGFSSPVVAWAPASLDGFQFQEPARRRGWVSRTYRYMEFDYPGGYMVQPIVQVAVKYRLPGNEWSEAVRALAVVDTASSLCTAPPEIAVRLGFAQPLIGPRHRVETGSGLVDYWMAEVELAIDGQPALRAHIGFGGTKRNMHLGYLNVLEHFRAEFRPYEGTFSLDYVPPKLADSIGWHGAQGTSRQRLALAHGHRRSSDPPGSSPDAA